MRAHANLPRNIVFAKKQIKDTIFLMWVALIVTAASDVVNEHASIARSGKVFAVAHLHTLPAARQFYNKLHKCDTAASWGC